MQIPDLGSGGFWAGAGAGFGMAMAGLSWAVKNFRSPGGNGSNGIGAKIDQLRRELGEKIDHGRHEVVEAIKEHHDSTRKITEDVVTRALLQRDLENLRAAKHRETRGG